MRVYYLGRQNSWLPIQKCDAEIPIKKGSVYRSIKRTQFPLILTWTSTVHKVQVLSLKQRVIDFDLEK